MSHVRLLVKEMRGYFTERAGLQERLLKLSRRVVRNSSRALTASHRGDEKRAEQLLNRARRDLKRLMTLSRRDPWLYTAGASLTAQQEYAEAVLFRSLTRSGKFMNPKRMGITYPAYLGALADVIGELRRAVLEALRRNEVERAGEILELMEEAYETLMEFDYADSVVHGMKRKQDVARSILEKTRGDLTFAVRQEKLSRELGGR